MARFRANLRWVVASAATPYGYTLAVWTTGAIVAHRQGLPDELGALGFAGGAVLAFALTGAIAQGHLGRVEAPVFPGFSVWQVLHLAGLAAAILLSSAISRVADGELVWPVAGFSTTAIYMLAVAAQLMLRSRRAA
jgi:hypothetical protein